MTFDIALRALKDYAYVARSGWNGKNMFLLLVNANDWSLSLAVGEDRPLLPFIAMKTADNKLVPWLASQTDILADDWEVIGQV